MFWMNNKNSYHYFRLYYQESWSQTRGLWSDAWWEVYHCLFCSELLVSFCLKSKHVLAKISVLSKGGPELVKINKTVSPEFEKSTERGSCSRYFIDESDVLWRAFFSWFLETRFAKSEPTLLLHIYHIFKRGGAYIYAGNSILGLNVFKN